MRSDFFCHLCRICVRVPGCVCPETPEALETLREPSGASGGTRESLQRPLWEPLGLH